MTRDGHHARLHAELAARPDPAEVVLVRTAMARGDQQVSDSERALFEAASVPRLETNADLARVVDQLIADPRTAQSPTESTSICPKT